MPTPRRGLSPVRGQRDSEDTSGEQYGEAALFDRHSSRAQSNRTADSHSDAERGRTSRLRNPISRRPIQSRSSSLSIANTASIFGDYAYRQERLDPTEVPPQLPTIPGEESITPTDVLLVPLAPFVPSVDVFPTVIATPNVGFALPRGNYLGRSFTTHIEGPLTAPGHEEPRFHHWRPLPFSEALGMPLFFAPWAVYRNNFEYNYLVRTLSIDVDLEKLLESWEGRGTGWIQPVSYKGGAMLVLGNGKALKPQHMEALAAYIDFNLTEVVDFFRGGTRTETELRKVMRTSNGKLTPKAFVQFWFKYMKRKLSYSGDGAWCRVECPVDDALWRDDVSE